MKLFKRAALSVAVADSPPEPAVADLAQKDHIVLNHEAVAHAHALVAAGKINHGEWDESKLDRNSSNGSAFLGKDTSMKPEDAGYWKYPVIAGGEVNRKALGSAAAYARKNGLGEIADAATAIGDAADKKRPATAQASSVAEHKTACLRSSAAFNEVKVNDSDSAILNAAVMTIGDAEGHGFSIDSTTLQQVSDLINRSPNGVAVRFKHPGRLADANGAPPDALGTDVGYLRNARVVGNSVRGDVYLADYAEVLPGLGNVKDYLLRKAKNDPTGFGMSAVIAYEVEPKQNGTGQVTSLVARVSDVEAVDFVSRPAANPNGLLSSQTSSQPRTAPAVAPTPRKVVLSMNPKKKYLIDNHGLSADATDEQMQTMYDSLSNEEKAKCDAAMSAPPSPATGLSKVPDAANAAAIALQVQKAQLIAEGERVTMIRQLSAQYGDKIPAEIVQLSIGSRDTIDQAMGRFLAHLAKTCKPIANVAVGSIDVGETKQYAHLSAQMSDAIRLRAQCKIEKPVEGAKEMAQLSVIDMGRRYLNAMGVEDAYGLSRIKVWEMLAQPRRFGGRYAMLAEGTSSFANVTLDAINKTLRQAYLDGGRNWDKMFRQTTAPDFKNINRIALSDSPGLVSRNAGGEIKYGVMSDSKEVYALTEYVSGIRLTRQAIINDDLDAFGRIPMLQGNAARRKEDDVAFAILTANAAMSDTGLLFNATAVTTSGGHANYDTVTANVGAPSVTTLSLGRSKMRVQKGPKGAYLNLIPKFLLVPAALESVAEQYTSANFVALQSSTINPFATTGSTPLRVVIEPRLDASSVTKWYMAADISQIDTIEVCFLQDEPEPVLKQETEFDTDDVKFAIRHTVAAQAIDFRGLYANAGA